MTAALTAFLERLWGCGDLDALFTGHLLTPAPWPRAPRLKHMPSVDVGAVAELINQPVDLSELDPRGLYASQPWVLRHHVAYYRTGEWERTGRTSADRHLELNHYPVVVPDTRGRPVIVAGHHRATAALINGVPLLVRIAAATARIALTPLLFLDPTRGVGPPRARELIDAGQRASVSSLDDAGQVLVILGLTDDEIHRRLALT